MDILSEIIYEITTFNFMIWLLVFLTVVLLGIPLLIVFKRLPKIAAARQGKTEMLIRRGQESVPGLIPTLSKFVLGPALFVLFFWVVFGYIFAFSMVGSREYDCAVEQARKNPRVIEALGGNIEPGNFAWISSYESGGGTSNAYFRLLLKGSKGIGNLYVSTYSAPAISTMQLDIEHDGGSERIYSGSFPCR